VLMRLHDDFFKKTSRYFVMHNDRTFLSSYSS
jgi:hypothetical protein